MTRFLYILFLILNVSQTIIIAQPEISKKQFHLYLLAGQSNMAGRGTVEMEDKTPHERVWMWTKNNEWQLAIEPLHFDKPTVVGVGPGLAFAKMMADLDTNIVIGLIPCAVGGSPIEMWQPTKYYEPTKSYPYDDALKRTKTAMQTGILKGILWQQGESDSDSIRAKIYGEKLILLVKMLRKDLKMKRLPFVAGTISEFYIKNHSYAKTVNEGIEQLPKYVKNVAIVNASGLTDKGDKTHFDSASARELGRRYAAVFQKYYNKK